MKSQVMAALLVVASSAPFIAVGAQTRSGAEMNTARVRYVV